MKLAEITKLVLGRLQNKTSKRKIETERTTHKKIAIVSKSPDRCDVAVPDEMINTELLITIYTYQCFNEISSSFKMKPKFISIQK